MKKIIVTGCSQGIGLFIANELLKLDYEVYGISRNKPTSEFKFNFIKCDVSNSDSVKEIFSKFRRDPNVYALLNVAGIASMNLLISTPEDTIKRTIETNKEKTDERLNQIFKINNKIFTILSGKWNTAVGLAHKFSKFV